MPHLFFKSLGMIRLTIIQYKANRQSWGTSWGSFIRRGDEGGHRHTTTRWRGNAIDSWFWRDMGGIATQPRNRRDVGGHRHTTTRFMEGHCHATMMQRGSAINSQFFMEGHHHATMTWRGNAINSRFFMEGHRHATMTWRGNAINSQFFMEGHCHAAMTWRGNAIDSRFFKRHGGIAAQPWEISIKTEEG